MKTNKIYVVLGIVLLLAIMQLPQVNSHPCIHEAHGEEETFVIAQEPQGRLIQLKLNIARGIYVDPSEYNQLVYGQSTPRTYSQMLQKSGAKPCISGFRDGRKLQGLITNPPEWRNLDWSCR